MPFDQIVSYFLPVYVKSDKTHRLYHELRIVVSTVLIALPLVLLFPLLLSILGKPVIGYLVNAALLACILISCKLWGHYRIPMTTTALVTYYIIYDWIAGSGWIYSSNVIVLHMYLLGAIWTDKRYGWWVIFTNIAFFGMIYLQTLNSQPLGGLTPALGDPLYALVMNVLITIFFGGFLAYLQVDQERDRIRIRALQEQKINVLDEAVKERTSQLNSIRENIATDFHDETGNMLAAITRQATMLKVRLSSDSSAQPIVDGIIKNSTALYASSKDFLWHLNHNSDEPEELFDYLTSYGQLFYNQFDIDFSSAATTCPKIQLVPSAALNLIYIFKEAMTNVVKHAAATDVGFNMTCDGNNIIYSLNDNGRWRQPSELSGHYGLTNIKRRCAKNGFKMELFKNTTGTQIIVQIPLNHHEHA